MSGTIESLNFLELKAFALTYEQGSFALVAQKYGKHASTYSRRVSNLEVDLGLDLFERHGSRLVPTVHGQSLYHPAKSILTEVEHFGQRVELCLEENEPHLSIGIDTSLNCFVPQDCIAQIVSEFPATELSVLTGNTEQIITLVDEQNVDVGLVLTSFNYPSAIVNNKLFDFGFIRVMAPKYAAKVGISLQHAVEPSAVRSLTQIVLAPLNQLGINTQNYSSHLLNVDSFEMAKSLTLQGLGWCNLPLVECQESLDKGELIPFRVKHDHDLTWSVDALWQMEKSRGPVARRFVGLFSLSVPK